MRFGPRSGAVSQQWLCNMEGEHFGQFFFFNVFQGLTGLLFQTLGDLTCGTEAWSCCQFREPFLGVGRETGRLNCLGLGGVVTYILVHTLVIED